MTSASGDRERDRATRPAFVAELRAGATRLLVSSEGGEGLAARFRVVDEAEATTHVNGARLADVFGEVAARSGGGPAEGFATWYPHETPTREPVARVAAAGRCLSLYVDACAPRAAPFALYWDDGATAIVADASAETAIRALGAALAGGRFTS